jgi:hypothetical protein
MENYIITRRDNKMEQEILINTYIEGLYLKEDLQYMEEGLKDVVAKFTQPVLKRILPQMFNIASTKNPAEYEKTIAKHGIKRVKVNERDIADLTNRFPEEIQQGATFARRVIDNSIPKGSKSAKTLASYFIALLAKIKNPKDPNLMSAVKAELKVYIPKIRNFYEEVQTKSSEAGKRISSEDMADVAIGIASIVAAGILTGMALVAGYFLVTSIMSILSALVWIVPIATFIGLLYIGYKAGEGI